VLADGGQKLVSDGEWHTIYVSRPTVDHHMLKVIRYLLHFCRRTQPVGAAFAMATWLSVCLSR